MKGSESGGFTPNQASRLNDFFKTSALLSEEENAALEGDARLTYEQFRQLSQKLTDLNCLEAHRRLVDLYPDFWDREAKELDAENM
ncbi:MAG: hypothetical protein Q4C73_10975 [Eubacteriales bacterium]|nr:hypothetical protein [Eubacteriales bacterium]